MMGRIVRRLWSLGRVARLSRIALYCIVVGGPYDKMLASARRPILTCPSQDQEDKRNDMLEVGAG